MSEITVFLGITSAFEMMAVLLAAVGQVLTPVYLPSMCCWAVFWPKDSRLGLSGGHPPSGMTIALSLLVSRLAIGVCEPTIITIAAGTGGCFGVKCAKICEHVS